jgi:hypothetical protein
MGRITFKYRIEVTANVGYISSIGKNRKMTNEQLDDFRRSLNNSFLKGGANEVKDGIVPHISKMVMKPNAYFDTNKIVAQAVAPMFEVA